MPGVELAPVDLVTRLKTKPGIESLCSEGVEEGEYLDFKRDETGYLPSPGRKSKAKAKRDFVRDVTAFANHLGGFIVIGVDENRKGRATAAGGIVDAEAVVAKLTGWLSQEGLIRPLVIEAHVRTIDLGGTRAVVVVDIPVRAEGVVHEIDGERGAEVYVRLHRNNKPLSESEAAVLRARKPISGFPQPMHPALHQLARWIPNVITALRVPLAVAAAVQLLTGHASWAFGLYLAALFTDVLDGMFARAIKAVTEVGKDFDRWADMFCNLVAGIGVAAAFVFIDRRIAPVAALVALLVGVTASRVWIKPHSLAAKLRSGALRAVLVGFYWWRLPTDDKIVGAVAAGALGIVAGAYEAILMEREFASGRRGIWTAEPEPTKNDDRAA